MRATPNADAFFNEAPPSRLFESNRWRKANQSAAAERQRATGIQQYFEYGVTSEIIEWTRALLNSNRIDVGNNLKLVSSIDGLSLEIKAFAEARDTVALSQINSKLKYGLGWYLGQRDETAGEAVRKDGSHKLARLQKSVEALLEELQKSELRADYEDLDESVTFYPGSDGPAMSRQQRRAIAETRGASPPQASRKNSNDFRQLTFAFMRPAA